MQKGASGATVHSRSQGLLGVFGLSGVEEDFREREKQNRRGETEMGRDRLHGRWVDGIRICKKKKKKERIKQKRFSLGCDTQIPKSPSSEHEEADDEGLDVSKNVS